MIYDDHFHFHPTSSIPHLNIILKLFSITLILLIWFFKFKLSKVGWQKDYTYFITLNLRRVQVQKAAETWQFEAVSTAACNAAVNATACRPRATAYIYIYIYIIGTSSSSSCSTSFLFLFSDWHHHLISHKNKRKVTVCAPYY